MWRYIIILTLLWEVPYPQLSNLLNWTRVSQKSESQISVNSRRKNINLSYHKKLMKTGILPQSNLANMVCKFYDPRWFAILKLWELYSYDLFEPYDTNISYGLSSRSNINVWKSYWFVYIGNGLLSTTSSHARKVLCQLWES